MSHQIDEVRRSLEQAEQRRKAELADRVAEANAEATRWQSEQERQQREAATARRQEIEAAHQSHLDAEKEAVKESYVLNGGDPQAFENWYRQQQAELVDIRQRVVQRAYAKAF